MCRRFIKHIKQLSGVPYLRLNGLISLVILFQIHEPATVNCDIGAVKIRL